MKKARLAKQGSYVVHLTLLVRDPSLVSLLFVGVQVRKMGDRILSQIIPILREGMASPAATTRQVCCWCACNAPYVWA